ncbi:mitochondrial carrier [Lactarius hatsudake]|nr:mitochondrial carrier [Lactarius hatsudake]
MAFSTTSLLLIAIFLVLALVRLRANYNPKGLQLEPKDGVQAHTGPVLTSFLLMSSRVRRLEVGSAPFHSLVPILLSNVVLSQFPAIFLGASLSSPRKHGIYNSPATKICGTLLYSIFSMLISLPAMIITYRSIITPYQLPYFSPLHSLRVLLTPTERRLLHITYAIVGLRIFRHLLLPSLSHVDDSPHKAISLFSTAILEVISTRLAVLRNHGSAEFDSVTQEKVGDTEDLPEYSPDEDVIELMNDTDPYLGLRDCVKKIIDEEGWRTLYRGWRLTMFGVFAQLIIA